MSNMTTISKSIRLPTDLVEFIEAQEGSNFSEKLVSILLEYRDGDADRQRVLESYRQGISRYKELFNRLISDYGEARRIIIHMHRYLDDMQRMAARAVAPPPEPEDPDLKDMPFT